MDERLGRRVAVVLVSPATIVMLGLPLLGVARAAAAAPVMAGGGGGSPVGRQAEPALEEFKTRVERYAALHRRLEGPLPPLEVTDEPAQLSAARAALAEAIRDARADARQGDIFTPEVSAFVRGRLLEALDGRDVRAFVDAINEEHDEVPEFEAFRPAVNAEYPGPLPPGMMPPSLLRALPGLPESFEYRIVRRDLIFWDTHAGLIVDFLPEALPER